VELGHVVGDLAWARITRWRESLCRLFDNRKHLDRLPLVSNVQVTFSPAEETSARYLGAWLISALTEAGAAAQLTIAPGPSLSASFSGGASRWNSCSPGSGPPHHRKRRREVRHPAARGRMPRPEGSPSFGVNGFEEHWRPRPASHILPDMSVPSVHRAGPACRGRSLRITSPASMRGAFGAGSLPSPSPADLRACSSSARRTASHGTGAHLWVDERAVPRRSGQQLQACTGAQSSPPTFQSQRTSVYGRFRPAGPLATPMTSAVLRSPGEFPHFIPVHRGIGPDGHSASLFPGDP
jgi:hypothetical protein